MGTGNIEKKAKWPLAGQEEEGRHPDTEDAGKEEDDMLEDK